jgi:hypothetical protein
MERSDIRDSWSSPQASQLTYINMALRHGAKLLL